LAWGLGYFYHWSPDIIWDLSVDDALFWHKGILHIEREIDGK
jgi:hypothetical protein